MKAIIFDLDGTLVDTLVDIANALDTVLAERDLPTVGLERTRAFLGEGARSLIELALGERYAGRVDEVLAAFKLRYAAHVVVSSHPYPGVEPLVQELSRRQIALAVLSNKPDDMTQQVVRRLFAPGQFAVIHGAREGVPLKPDPRAVREILADLAVAPEQAALVGDGIPDMRVAIAAGIRPIAVAWGYRPAAELAAAGATTTISKPLDLLAFLDNLAAR